MTVAPKKRKNMKHLAEMNDYEFCEWIACYDSKQRLELSWKLDGFFLRFGKDTEGKFWFQTARSPVLYDPMEIIWHSISKGYDHDGMTRAENYFHLLKRIESSTIMHHLAPDSGLECEVFDTAAAVLDKEANTLRFVNIPYDADFFKRNITLFVYRLIVPSTGQVWVDGYRGELALDGNIPTLGAKFDIDVDMQYFKKCVFQTNGAPRLALKSLKHADRALKLETKALIATIKSQFCAYVLAKVAKMNKMGKNFEGVVVTVNNTEYKITTEYFRELMLFKGMLGG